MENILEIAADYVMKLFGNHLPKGITYHNLIHVKDVVDTAKLIGEKSVISSDQMEMLLLSAWFHDVGIIEQYVEHEEKSADICREFLEKHNYPANKIETIVRIIRSTRVPQKPTNLLEKIMCDADLSHNGKKGFIYRSQLLRVEWKNMLGKEFTDSEWVKINIDFLLDNKFHTKFAKSFYDGQRMQNLMQLQKKSMTKEMKASVANPK